MPHPAESRHQHPAFVDDAGQMLHGQLQSTFGGGDSIGDGKLLLQQIIMNDQPPLGGEGMGGRGDFACKDTLTGM